MQHLLLWALCLAPGRPPDSSPFLPDTQRKRFQIQAQMPPQGTDARDPGVGWGGAGADPVLRGPAAWGS